MRSLMLLISEWRQSYTNRLTQLIRLICKKNMQTNYIHKLSGFCVRINYFACFICKCTIFSGEKMNACSFNWRMHPTTYLRTCRTTGCRTHGQVAYGIFWFLSSWQLKHYAHRTLQVKCSLGKQINIWSITIHYSTDV